MIDKEKIFNTVQYTNYRGYLKFTVGSSLLQVFCNGTGIFSVIGLAASVPVSVSVRREATEDSKVIILA